MNCTNKQEKKELISHLLQALLEPREVIARELPRLELSER